MLLLSIAATVVTMAMVDTMGTVSTTLLLILDSACADITRPAELASVALTGLVIRVCGMVMVVTTITTAIAKNRTASFEAIDRYQSVAER